MTRSVISGMCTLCCLMVAASDQASNPGSRQGVRALELRLDTTVKSFVRLEPVIVTYSVSNPTNNVIKSRIRMAFETGGLKIGVEPDGGHARDFYAGPVADSILTEDVQHQPGEIRSDAVRVFFNDLANNLAFPTAGRYTIRAKMLAGIDDGPIFLVADPVQIEIAEAAGRDKELTEALGSVEKLIELLRYGPGRYCAGQPGPSCFEELKSFINHYRESAYSPHLVHSLASAVDWGGLEVTPRYQVAEDLLREFLERWPTHALVPDVQALLFYALEKGGKKKEAISVMGAFERAYPGKRAVIEQMHRRIQGG